MAADDCAARLAEARAALHQLNIGRQRVEVRWNDRSVRYTAATKTDLQAYITQLEGECGDDPAATANRRRPLGLRF